MPAQRAIYGHLNSQQGSLKQWLLLSPPTESPPHNHQAVQCSSNPLGEAKPVLHLSCWTAGPSYHWHRLVLIQAFPSKLPSSPLAVLNTHYKALLSSIINALKPRFIRPNHACQSNENPMHCFAFPVQRFFCPSACSRTWAYFILEI